MQVHDTIAGFRKALAAARADGLVVGLVPTMGYLHDGHVSLMRAAAAECDVVAATIFVNPLQFAPTEDLDAYPRDLDRDSRLAEAAGVAHLFTPPVDEMYPDGHPMLTTVSVAELGEGCEGASRPTHFTGVATVVAKLFNIAGPSRAYFGEKDWQQLQIIRRMVRDLDFPVEVVGCPIVRELDGLAMSSRNVYLSPDQRTAATVLHRALLAGQAAATSPVATSPAATSVAGASAAGAVEAEAIEAAMAEVVAGEPLAELDYATAADDRLLIAVRFGATRLIDNMPRRPATTTDVDRSGGGDHPRS